MTKKQVTFTLDEKTFEDFRTYCQLNALKLSAKIELLMNQEMQKAQTNPTLIKLFNEMVDKRKNLPADQIKIPTNLDPISENNVNVNFNNSMVSKESLDKKVPSIEHLKRLKNIK